MSGSAASTGMYSCGAEELGKIRLVVRLLRFGDGFVDHLLKPGVAEVARVGAARF